MIFDYSKLRGKIREVCGSEKNFATCLGISQQSVSSKLNNKSSWNADEIVKTFDLLGLKSSEIPEYFFAEKKDAAKRWDKQDLDNELEREKRKC